jgi:hypothetical protein
VSCGAVTAADARSVRHQQRPPPSARKMYPSIVSTLVIAVLLVGNACARATSDAITSTARANAGCYRLALGPWRAPTGALLEGHRGDAPEFAVPEVVELKARESTRGHLQVQPQPSAQSGFRYATWYAAPDTLVLEWSNDGVFRPMLVMRLSRVDGEYRGRTQLESDYQGPRAYREAVARQTSCGRQL